MPVRGWRKRGAGRDLGAQLSLATENAPVFCLLLERLPDKVTLSGGAHGGTFSKWEEQLGACLRDQMR